MNQIDMYLFRATIAPIGRRRRLSSIWRAVLRLWVRQRGRRQLARLSDRMLWDIGITRGQAEEEARKPVWRD